MLYDDVDVKISKSLEKFIWKLELNLKY
jgi:hypothetical protein